jgi:hypothetical protein
MGRVSKVGAIMKIDLYCTNIYQLKMSSFKEFRESKMQEQRVKNLKDIYEHLVEDKLSPSEIKFKVCL